MNPIGEFGAMLIAALIIAGAFLVGRGIGLGIRSWIQFFRDRRVENRATAVPQPPPPQMIRPVGPGPLWQNSRLYEEAHLRGQTIAPQGFTQIGALPEVQPSRTASSEEMVSDNEEEYPRHLAGGHEYRS